MAISVLFGTGPLQRRSRRAVLSKLLLGGLSLVPLAFAPVRPVAAQIAWVPQQRPSSVAQDPKGADPTSFDWTGLDGVLHQTDGTSQSYKAFFANGSYEHQELDFGGDITGATGDWTVNGTSTYKWLWTPPGTPQGVHNDPNKNADDPTQPFPTPSLFVLGLTIPYVEGAYDPGYDPLTVQGNVKDGFDANWNPMFNLLQSDTAEAPPNSLNSNNQFVNDLPRRSVLKGMLESDHVTSSVTLSPYVHVDVSTKTASGDGYGNGYGYGYLLEANYALFLGYPNPYIRPDLGDFSGGTGAGSNQFVYDAQAVSATQPGGVLSVPAQIIAPGVLYLDDFDWLIKPPTGSGAVVDWQFGNPQQGPHDPFNLTRQTSPDNSIYILAPDTKTTAAPVPSATTGQSIPAITFTGLPVYNTGFGTTPVTMTVKTYDPASKATTTNGAQTAYIQTFFQGAASNFPLSNGLYTGPSVEEVPPGTTYSPPNWYHYYTQVYDIASRYGMSVRYEPGTGPYNSRSFSQDDPANNYPVEIHDDASLTRDNFSVFDTNPVPDPTTGTHLARYIGRLSVSGVFAFVTACGHEAGHVVTYQSPDDTSPGSTIYNATASDLSPSWKMHHHLDVTKSDTTGAYSGFKGDATSGDAQLTADVNAIKDLFAYSDSLQGSLPQDWSDGGINYSRTAPPYFSQERYNNDATSLISGKPPVFYFRFNPDGGIKPYGSGNTPVLTADGHYEIRGAADLQALYPNVVIGLLGLPYENPAAGP